MNVTFITSAFNEGQYPAPDKPEIAFAGRSNVGKSSLINVLVNRKGMAKTSSKPGRTQSINFFLVNSRLYLVDLPGYGFARVPITIKKSWQKMVETYLSGRTNLKAVIVIMDIRREPTAGDLDLLNWLRHYQIEAIIVLTKTDKLTRQQARRRADRIGREVKQFTGSSPITFSAKTRTGRENIWKAIEQVL
jgi:GTP-binding protein